MKWKSWLASILGAVVILFLFFFLFIGSNVYSPDLVYVLYFLIPLIFILTLPFILEKTYFKEYNGRGIIIGSIISFVISLISYFIIPGELGFGGFAFFFIWAITIVIFLIGLIIYFMKK
ncbi:MAG: hypothetical protein NUV97_00850 [archaeon]|nr:hypothetical protein [archaeon]MCR4323490.1 hypothetical protein [Nanoarchaeota archaeon]